MNETELWNSLALLLEQNEEQVERELGVLLPVELLELRNRLKICWLVGFFCGLSGNHSLNCWLVGERNLSRFQMEESLLM